jgi:hypothetical protein
MPKSAGGELVPEEAACPRCGERRMGNLKLHDDTVDCLICGCRYALPEDEEPETGSEGGAAG